MIHPKDTNYKRIIQSPRWQMVRNSYIRSHPLCECCKEKLATQVHHRIPLMRYRNDLLKMEQLAFDEENLMSVCSSCHIKLHKELGKYKNQKEHSRQLHEEQCNSFYERYFK